MTPLELIIAECQSTGDPSVQAWAVEAVAELAALRAERDDLLAANRLSLRNVERMIYALPIDCDRTERKSLEPWATFLRAAIARATGQEVSE